MLENHRPFLSLSARKTALGLILIAATPLMGLAQLARAQQTTPSAEATFTRASAMLADRPPLIDGSDDDVVWRAAQRVTGFRAFDPKEDCDPSFPTGAKISYDAEKLYAFTGMSDPHPVNTVSM